MRLKQLVCVPTGRREHHGQGSRARAEPSKQNEQNEEQSSPAHEELDCENVTAEDPALPSELTQTSESIELSFERLSKRRSNRSSSIRSKRYSNHSLEDVVDQVLSTSMPLEEEEETLALETVVESLDDSEQQTEGAFSFEEGDCIHVLPQIFRTGDRRLIQAVCSFLPVRQVVELTFVSRFFLTSLQGTPLHLEYFKRTFDIHTLDRIFSEESQLKRLTVWRVAGVYTDIGDLTTLFQVIDPACLEFLGILNPNITAIGQVTECVSLCRFELHGCEKPISLEPLLKLRRTLRAVSLLACKEIRDITLLERLPNLRVMSTFKSTNVCALPDLSRCRDLELLSIGECVNIRDVRTIKHLTKLRVLDLSCVRCVTSLSFLKNAKQLRVLILDSCKNLEDVSPLSVCGQNLSVLRLKGIMNLADISGIEHCKNLTCLELGDLIHIKSLKCLRGCSKLVDLNLQNCVSLTSLSGLEGSSGKLKRLIVSGCRKLSENDAAFVDSLPNLVVFECDRCNPVFLVHLMLSSRSAIALSTEPSMSQITEVEFAEKAYPVILEIFLQADRPARRRAALRMIQNASMNVYGLLHMVEKGMVDHMFDCALSLVEEEEDEDQEGQEATTLEILRVLSRLLHLPSSANSTMLRKGAVEYLVRCITSVKLCSCCGDLWSHRTTFDQEYIVAEAARCLALLFQQTLLPLRKGIVDRISARRLIRSVTTLISSDRTLDHTRKPLLLLLREIIEADSGFAMEAIHAGMVDATTEALLHGSNETRMIGCSLLAMLTESSTSSTAGEVLKAEGILKLFTTFLQSQSKDLIRNTLAILRRAPSAFYLPIIQTPSLVSTILTKTSHEILTPPGDIDSVLQQDSRLVLNGIKVFEALSSKAECVNEMVLEDIHLSHTDDPCDETSRRDRLSVDPIREQKKSLFALRRTSSMMAGEDCSSSCASDLVGDSDDGENEDALAEFYNLPQSREETTRRRARTSLSSFDLVDESNLLMYGPSYRVSCNFLADVFTVALINSPSLAVKASVARTIINFSQASENVQNELFAIFSDTEKLISVVDLVTKQKDAMDSMDVGLELLFLFIEDKKRLILFAQMPSQRMHEFCRSLVFHIQNPRSGNFWTSQIVAILLKSSCKRQMLDLVIAPVLSAIDKRKSQLHHFTTRLFDRDSFQMRGERDQLYEEARWRKCAALRFLSVLLIDRNAREAGESLLLQSRPEAIFVSMNDPEKENRELSVLLLNFVMSTALRKKSSDQVYSRLGIALQVLFDKKQQFAIFCLSNILGAGSSKARKNCIQLLAQLAQNPSFASLILSSPQLPVKQSTGGILQFGRESKRGSFVSLVDESSVTEESESELLEVVSSAGSEESCDTKSVASEIGLEEKGEGDEYHGLTGVPSRVPQRLSDKFKAVFGKRFSRRRSSARSISSIKSDTPLPQAILDTLLQYLLDERGELDEEAAALRALEEDEVYLNDDEMRYVGDLLAALAKHDSERLMESVIQPLIDLVGKSDIIASEVRSQERALALFEFLSTCTENVALVQILDGGRVHEALACYFCSETASETGKTRCVIALANYVGGNPERILNIERTTMQSLGDHDENSFLRRLVQEMHSSNARMKEAIHRLLQPVFFSASLSNHLNATLGSSDPVKKPPGISTKTRAPLLVDLPSGEMDGTKVELRHEVSRCSSLSMDEDSSSDEKVAALSSCMVQYGLLDVLGEWQQGLVSEEGSGLQSFVDVEFTRLLLKPALFASASDNAAAQRLQGYNFVKLFVHLFVTDDRTGMKEIYARALVDLDEGFLSDESAVFRSSFSSHERFKSLLEKEHAYEMKQLEIYPVAFQRVRGFPLPYVYDNLNLLSVSQWTTMAMKQQNPAGTVQLVHGKFYYEVEVFESSPDVVFGWVSNNCNHGMLRDLGSFSIGSDGASWGLRSEHLSDLESKDIIGLAADIKARKLVYTLNGRVCKQQKLGPEIGEIQWLSPAISGSYFECVFNFGSQPFRFRPPTRSFRSFYSSVTLS